MQPLHFFSVDVEDYFHVSAFSRVVSPDSWADQESRVVMSTNRILDLLEKHRVRGIFYILGWVADRFPDLVLKIKAGGHVLGSHTYWHKLIYDQSAMEFGIDLAQSCEAIRNITGDPVKHFRAPSFSITRKSLWAIKILQSQGIEFDSSIVPILHDRYGIPGTPRCAYQLSHGDSTVQEFPVSVLRWMRLMLPVGGGGYFRIFPWWFTRWAFKKLEKEGVPIHFYIHPWEIDSEQPRIRQISPITQFRHYRNIDRTFHRLDRMLGEFSFGRVIPPISTSTLALE
jgi:polysaccharide deacetylase family protein (PEP-CTERM system associated)